MKREVDLLRFPQIKRQLGTRTEEHRVIARRFDKEFFDGSRDTGYGGYKYDGRWKRVALRMMLNYGLDIGATVLDVGCGKGFFVNDCRTAGLRAYGIDVSEYAIGESIAQDWTMCEDVRDMAAWSMPERKWDLIVSINTLHNLEGQELFDVLRLLPQCSKQQYITVDAFRTDEERDRMMAWNLTAKTILHVDKWRELFKRAGYTGDYGWFIP